MKISSDTKKTIWLFLGVFLLAAILLGRGGGVSQKEYDQVVAENTKLRELKEGKKETVDPAKEHFEKIQGVSVVESGNGYNKCLSVICYMELSQYLEAANEKGQEIGTAMVEAKDKEWFDYDYVTVDFWCDSGVGRVVSWTSLANDLSKQIQVKKWYEEENVAKETTSNSTQQESTKPLLYEDDKIKIYYSHISDKGVVFLVENMTNATITVQADAVSINKQSTSDITMSDDVAPQSIGKVTAKCEDFKGVSNVETVGGQLRIFDWNKSFSNIEATFVNVDVTQ